MPVRFRPVPPFFGFRKFMTSSQTIIQTPVGPITLIAEGKILSAISFGKQKGATEETPALRAAAKQLEEYFAGKRTSFSVPLKAVGTPFQEAVWRALEKIPFGKTWSYAQVAKSIGKPKAV